MTEALFDSVNQGDRDFSAAIGKMKAAGVEAIYYGGYHTEAALIARQSAEAGLKAQLIGPDSLMTSEFWSISGPGGEGVLMTFAPDPTIAPEAKAIVERFKAQGFNPEGYTLYSYAAMQVYAQGAQWAGSLDNQKIAEALHGGRSIDTVIGKIGYDKKGDIVEPQFILYVWHDGKYKPL
ncbi:MAG: branched-chain amino acid ABC transporter substrate-binding protein [Dongiaceae bacterium]